MPRTIITEVPSHPSELITDWVETGTSTNATAATMVKAKEAGRRHYISSLLISTVSACTVQIQSDATASNVAINAFHMPAASHISHTFMVGNELKMPQDNKDIDIITSISGSITWTIGGFTI